jgi:hypothetical protein
MGLRMRWGCWGASFAVVTTTIPWENPEQKTMQCHGRLGITYTY